MNLSVTLTTLLAALAALNVEGYTNPITIKGYKMFDVKNGSAVAIKGIDYYPRPNAGTLDDNNIDFFTDDYARVWGPDIQKLAELGANAVRLYAVDPSKSHDEFMCALRAKGMYALIDLAASCENCAITKDAYPACYPSALKSRGEQIILAFAKYDNVLAFSAGNEVNHVVGQDATVNAPCQKKFIRDMRAFVGGCASIRKIPVGVVLADPDLTKNNRELNAKYYNCRTNTSDVYENAEWYGLNTYVDCDVSATNVSQAAGFLKLQTDFKGYGMTIPVMLTEYGCLNEGFPAVGDYKAQRTWRQASWLYSSSFRDVFAGGFAFEYSTENMNSKSTSVYPFTEYGPQNYGLGYFSPANCNHTTVPCVYNPMPNYANLATQYNATSVSSEAVMSAFTSDRTTLPTCPSIFANLAGSSWAGDSLASQACPTAVQSYTCPNQQSSGLWASGSGSGTTGSSSSGGSTSDTPTPTPTTATTTTSGSTLPSTWLATSAVSTALVSAIVGALF